MLDTGKKLLRIFKDNWKEDFIFDAINGQIYTYENFFKKTIEYKENLVKLGLKKNDQIVIIMNNSVDVVALYFAALFEGISIVSIDPLKGKEEMLEILSRVNYKKIFSNISELDFEEIENTENFKIRNLEVNYLDLTNIFVKIDYDSLFIITFTSGSTGKSKGVMHSFNNFAFSSEKFSKQFGFNKTHKFFHNLPMSYIGGILNLLILPLISESKIIISDRFDISKIINFWHEPIKYSANTFWFPPTIISLLLKLDRGDIGTNYSKKNKIIGLVGMAALKENVKKEFEEKLNRGDVSFHSVTVCSVYLEGAEIEGLSFEDCELISFQVRDASLPSAKFTDSSCKGLKTDDVDLGKACFDQADLNGCVFQNTDLKNASMKDCDLYGASFMDADLSGVDFSNADMGSSVFQDVELAKASFVNADLSSASFKEIHFEDTDFSNATLDDLSIEDSEGTIRYEGETIGVEEFLAKVIG